MSQQINLFEARLRPQKPHFSAATMALAVGATFALALGMQQLVAFQNRSLQNTLAQTDRRAAELREQTVRFAREFGEQGRSSVLAEEIARAEEQLRLRRELLENMQGGMGANAEGFSQYLTALARQSMNGVWLTGVDIDRPTGELLLRGRVLDGDLVPAYIRRLNQEPIFKGRPVTEMRLAAKADGGKRYVEFTLQIPLYKGAS
jgi:hypothetical protein